MVHSGCGSDDVDVPGPLPSGAPPSPWAGGSSRHHDCDRDRDGPAGGREVLLLP